MPAQQAPIPQRPGPLAAIALAITLVLLVALGYYLIDVALLFFAGVLLALVLRTPADALAARTRLTPGWAIAVVILLLVALLGGAGWLFGHTLIDQLSRLGERVPETLDQLRDKLANYDWLFGRLDPGQWLREQGGFLRRGISALVTTFGVLANVVVVFFIGIFLAVQPGLYLEGALRLVTKSRERRIAQVLNETAHTLRWWLAAKMCLMTLVGVAVAFALWLMDIPYAFALGVVAGLLEFIPYIGPLFGALPAILITLTEAPSMTLYVALLYVGVQTVQSYLIEPLVQQRAVYLPPVMVLLAQLVLGILVGALGVMLATPLAAVAMVWTRMLYIEDILGRRPAEHQGR